MYKKFFNGYTIIREKPMANQTYKNVVKALIDNGIDPDFANMFVHKGLKDVGETEDTIGEKKMGMVLQRHDIHTQGRCNDRRPNEGRKVFAAFKVATAYNILLCLVICFFAI